MLGGRAVEFGAEPPGQANFFGLSQKESTGEPTPPRCASQCPDACAAGAHQQAQPWRHPCPCQLLPTRCTALEKRRDLPQILLFLSQHHDQARRVACVLGTVRLHPHQQGTIPAPQSPAGARRHAPVSQAAVVWIWIFLSAKRASWKGTDPVQGQDGFSAASGPPQVGRRWLPKPGTERLAAPLEVFPWFSFHG